MDVHGCYLKGQPFLGALGGMVQQWYYVIASINKLYENDDMRSYYEKVRSNPSAVKSTSPKELIIEAHLVPFLLMAIKELKPESLMLCNTPQLQRICESFRVPMPSAGNGYDLAKLTKD